MTENDSYDVNSTISIIICDWWRTIITQNWDIPNRAIFSPNVHGWANNARSWLLRTRIIWIHERIWWWLSLPLHNTHPTWLSLTNELKFVDWRHQINSLSLVDLLLLINKFSFICEGQSCRVRITLTRHLTKFGASDWLRPEISPTSW